jgi:acyl dehydratase
MSQGKFYTTPRERYLEDYLEGAVHQFGSLTVTEDEIVRFDKHFDPQLFHTDPIAARQTVYGGVIAAV